MRLASCSSFAVGLVSVIGFLACGEDKKPEVDSTSTSASASASAKPSTSSKPSAVPSVKPSPGPEDAAAPAPSVIEFGDSGVTLEWTGSGVPCGAEACRDAVIADFGLELKGCCADGDICGLDLSQAGILVGLQNAGCEQMDRPGSADSVCPESEPFQTFLNPLEPLVLEPCCQADGQCGFLANFSGLGFGCVEPERFGQTGGQSCTYAP